MVDNKLLLIIPVCLVLGIMVGIMVSLLGFYTFDYNIPFGAIAGMAVGFSIVMGCCVGEVLQNGSKK